MIKITQKAIEKIKEISEAEGIGHNTVRLGVKGAGCAGWSYDMNYDDNINELDEIYDQDDVKIIIDQLSFQYLENVEIDYLDSPISAGFKFNNPAVKSSCGCGSSFSFGD